MTNPSQIEANRRNAKRSTGPKTKLGKSRAARNALRHGISAEFGKDLEASSRIEKLATAFLGDFQPCERAKSHALVAAESQYVLELAKFARAKAIEADCQNLQKWSGSSSDEQMQDAASSHFMLRGQQFGKNLAKILNLFDRYERRALSRRRAALRALTLLKGTSDLCGDRGTPLSGK